MNAGQRSARRAVANTAYLSRDTICSSCLSRLSHQSRGYAASVATAEAPSQQTTQHHIPPVTAREPRKAYRVLAAPVVSRPPIITRSLTGFEKAFYLYQKRLNERLALPFTRYFYFKKGTPADLEWKRKARSRKTAARDIGVYSAYGDEGWNDEVMVGSRLSEPDNQVEALIRDAEGKEIVSADLVGEKEAGGAKLSGDAKAGEGARKELDVQVERPMSRITEADRSNDTKSLSRKLDQSLYLLVKNKAGRWRFPEDRLFGKENIHQAAERIMVQALGLNMNTWVVGNHPVGHYQFNFPRPQTAKIELNREEVSKATESETTQYEQEEYGEKVFFMKARIMAGQADLAKNIYGDSDFQWLAKDEIKDMVAPKYWSSIKGMLVER